MYEWVISTIAASAAVGAFIYTARSFARLRKTEQVRLSESILTDLRNSVREFNILSSETPSNTDQVELRNKRMNRYLDQTAETLNWYCILFDIGEINDQHLVNYFRRTIIRWNDDFFVKDVGVDIISGDETKYPDFKKVYERFKKEEKTN